MSPQMNISPSQMAVSAGLSSPSISTVTVWRIRNLPRRFLLERVKDEAAADPLAGLDRGKEADAVEAVIERHLHAVGNEHRVRRHARKQRQRKESVRDGAAEPCRGSRCRIDVDELMVLGRVGEGVDPWLVDDLPARNAHFLANAAADFVEAGDAASEGQRRWRLIGRACEHELVRRELLDQRAQDRRAVARRCRSLSSVESS